MNGRYGLAKTPLERLAIAVVAGNFKYFQDNPEGVLPGERDYMDFLQPFIERELLESELQGIHYRTADARLREREIVISLTELVSQCDDAARHAHKKGPPTVPGKGSVGN